MLAVVAGLCVLGRWQWDVSESARGGIQNLLYAFQWWAMAVMVIYGWWRLLRDDAYPRVDDATNPLARPTTTASLADDGWTSKPSTADLIEAQLATADHETTAGETDEELAEYNQYLAWLNERSQRARR
jgi:hypothetical protein